MKLTIQLQVEDGGNNIVYSAEEALRALIYNYTNFGSAYCLPRWRNDLRGYNMRRATHTDSTAKWSSRVTITEL